MGQFLQQTHSMAPEQTKPSAIEWLAKLPAWQKCRNDVVQWGGS